MRNSIVPFLILCFISVVFNSCKKFIEIPTPKNELTGELVFENDATALAALTGIYSNMMKTDFGFSNSGITVYSGLASDEFLNYVVNSAYGEFFDNSLLPSNDALNSLWAEAYKTIYSANIVLEGAKNSKNLSAVTRKSLEGEAKFIRAFIHFYLFNLFGDIPLVLTTDYQANSSIARAGSTEVYSQIILDLQDVINLLQEDYISADRARPNKWAATALLARVYLYQEDWLKAEEQADIVINHSDLYGLENNLDDVFLTGSRESIWQLSPVLSQRNTNEAFYFIPDGLPTYISLTSQQVAAFEVNDQRRAAWVGELTVNGDTFFYPYKYKVKESGTVTENYSVLRLAELYLIRSEARARLDKIPEAQSDLDIIRERAGLPATTANSKPDLLTAIEQERRVELFAEWGHRWLDLRRYGHANEVLAPLKTGWQSTDLLFPIPQSQIENDPNTVQNPGY